MPVFSNVGNRIFYLLCVTESDILIFNTKNIAASFRPLISRRIFRRLYKFLLFSGCWIIINSSLKGQAVGDFGSKLSGNWSDPGSWIICVSNGTWAGATPAASFPNNNSTNVWIRSGHTITLNGGSRTCRDLNVEATGLLNGSQIIYIYGSLNVNGTISTGSSIRLYGTSINGSGSIGTTIALRVYSSNKTIVAGANLTFNCTVQFRAAGLTITNNGSVSIFHNTSISTGGFAGCGWTNSANSYLGALGSIDPVITLNASANGNTIEYFGSAAQNVKVPVTSYYNLTVSNTGVKTLAGNTTVKGNLLIGPSSALDVSNNNYSITLSGNWINNNITDGFSERGGELFFNGTAQQSLIKAGAAGTETFYNLTLNNSNGLLLSSGDLEIGNRFSFASGNISFSDNSDRVYLSPGNPASLNYTSVTGSRIIGKFERWISTAGTYLFPVGSSGNYNPANLIINSIPGGGSILSEFIVSDPGDNGLPLTDNGFEVSDSYSDGYWSFTAKNGFSCGDYSITLNGTGFSNPVYDVTRVLKRTAGGNWGFDGTHANAIGSVCYRNNLSGDISSSGTNFGLGHIVPGITDHPDNLNICAGSNAVFSITATGYSGLTYKWYKTPNTPLSDGGRFTGTDLNTLTITGVLPADAGDYYCIVTDIKGKTAQSNSATLTISAQPTGPALNTKTPDLPAVCDGQSLSATFSPGSGGTGCTDSYQYSFDVSGIWTPYTPGTNLNTTGHTRVDIQGQRSGCTVGAGCTGTAWATLASWSITPQPAGPALNAKTPDLAAVCDGQSVSATFSPGSGGTGCTDSYQYSFDGSGVWTPYTPGTNLNTTGHTSVDIQGQRSGCTVGAGCTGTAWATLASWSITPQPAGPALNAKTPDLAAVCDGQALSATFNPGSGGTGCTDSYQYSFDGSGIWAPYTPGTNLNTTGHTSVDIQGERSGCTVGTGCTGTAWATLASWNITPQPVGPALNTKTPDLSAVCDGQTLSATFNPGSGGTGCTDSYQYSFDGSGIWTPYTPGTNLNTTGHTSVDIQGQRSGCTVGAGCTGTSWATLASWSITPQPAGPALNAKTPDLPEVCDGQSVSATFNPGSGGTGCTDSYQYSFDGSGIWTPYTPGTNLNTTGHTSVDIQGQRSGCTMGAGCTGTAWATLASWIVNEYPALTSTSNPPDICSGSLFSYTPASGTSGTSFAWTRAAVTGITPEGSASGSGDPAEILTNTTAIPLAVRYIYTLTANGCTNPVTYNVDVIVNPLPSLTSTLTPPAICSGSLFSYLPESGTTGTSFDWTRAAVPGITASGPGTGTGDPNETLTNTTMGSLTVRYEYTLSANGCTNPSVYNVDVVVNPSADVNQPGNLIVCDGETIPEISFSTSNTGGIVTYTWTNDLQSIGISGPGTGNIPSFTAVNSGTAPVVATIEVTPHFENALVICDGPPKTFTITVNPAAHVKLPDNQVVCNNEPTLKVNFNTINTGGIASYTWENDQPSIGLPLNGMDSIPSFIAINAGNAPVVATVTVTPHFTSNGVTCDGPSKMFTITVDPTPQVIPSTLTQNICNNGITNIVIGSPSSFSSGSLTFDYSVSSTGGVTGFTSPMTGLPKNYVIADTLNNPTDQPQTVTYSILPVTSTGCASGPAEVVVTVLPTARVDKPDDKTLCNGENSALISLSSLTVGTVIFTWTNDQASIGLPSSGTGDIPPFTAINNEDIPVTATIRITPHFIYETLSCDGQPIVFTITVNPTPRIFPVPSDTIQCDSTTTGIRLESPSRFSNGSVTFKYIASSTGGLTGFTASASGLPNNSVIADTLINPSDEPQTVSYTITPVSPAGCNDGLPVNISVTVNPSPRIFPMPSDTIQCDSSTTNIRLRSPSIFTGGGSITFKYTASATGGTTGFTPNASGLLNEHIIKDELINPTDAPQTVTYSITPVSPLGCNDGPQVNITVSVNPTPRIFPLPGSGIICDSSSVAISIQSPSTFTSGFVSINLSADAPAGLSGYTSSAGGLPNGFVLNDTLVNLTDVPLTVNYRLVPLSGVSCNDGNAVYFTVTVNPTPRATPVNFKPDICYADNTLIKLTSPTVMTSGDIKFDYTILLPGGVTGNSAPGTDKLQDDILSFQYRNYNDSVQSVFFFITPKAGGVNCPAGKINSQEVRLHPEPARGITITKPFTCEAGAGLAALKAEISKGAGPYNLLWTGPVGYLMEDSIEIKNLYAGYYTLNVTDNLGCAGDTAINIANLSASPRIIPLPVRPNIHITCPGGNDGTARLYVRDGITPPYSYWLVHNSIDTVATGIFTGNYDPGNPTTFRLCTGLLAGQYNLVIRDLNGCETFRSSELKEPVPIVTSFNLSNFNGSNISCRGYSDGWADVNATGGGGSYTYFWSPASGTLSVNRNSDLLDSISSGKYYLRVTDQFGCVKTDSVILSDPPGMILGGSELSVSNDGNFQISCYGASDGYIKINVTGGSGIYTYLWIGPDGYSSVLKDIYGLKAGLYTCTVTDINGCILMPQPSFNLTEPLQLNISSIVSQSFDGNYNINCYGGTGTLDITITGGSTGSYIYTWTTADGSGIVSGQQDQNSLQAGTYNLSVTDANGCNASADIVFTQPPAIVTELIPTHITCQLAGLNNGSINLNLSGGIVPYSYAWSTGESLQDISGLGEGYYSVTVTDANGCQKTDSVRVNLPPSLYFSRVIPEYNGYNITCNGRADGSILINPTSGTPPYVYSWQGPEGFSASANGISGLIGGQYVLLITDSNQCTANDTIVLTEPGKLSMSITSSLSNTGEHNIDCAGGETGSIEAEAINNAGPVDYIWADGLLGKLRTGLKEGRYRIIITDSNGCSADSSVTLTAPDSIRLSFSVTQPFCTDMPDGSIALDVSGGTNSGYTFLWSDNSTSQNIATAVSGLYSVTVTDANNCSLTGSVLVHPVNEVCLVIPNAISPNGDLVNDEWNIGLKELYPEIEVKIFNRWGELIWKSDKGYPMPWDGRTNGSVLPIDSYHYIIDLNNGSKLIIGNITIVK